MSLTRRFKNRNLSIIVTIIMIMAMFPSIAFAASPTDLANHWAKVQVGDWMDKGLVNGYPDGTFKPDNNITRAEFMVIVNGAFGYKEKATVDYKDVTADAWYADAVAKAKAAGYFTGYADGTAKPDSPISRQETAVVIMKVKGLTQNESAAAKFTDAAGISQWSKGAIGATVTAGFMNGYPDGSFKANNPITRAEAVVALSKAMNKPAPTPEIPADDSKVYDQAGTYGPATGSITVTGDVTIKAKDVILQNTIIEGDLTIDKAVGDGNVTLKKVVVKGNTYINGGGTNSVYLIDTQTGKTYVIKDNGPVRIVASGSSDINQLIAQSSVKVEEVDLTGKGFEGIIVDKKVDGKIEINLVNAKVENFQVKTEGVTVNTDNNTTISTLVADAKVDVTGKGTVQSATINASGVTFETKPTTQTVASGVKEPTVNKSSTGGGGGGGSSTVAVSVISVTGEGGATTITTKNGTLQMVATVTPSNASNKAVTWDFDDNDTDTGSATINTETGLLTAEGNGTVTVRATSVSTPSVSGTKVITISGQEVEPVEPEPITGSFESTNNVGIAPETAGEAAGKIYAEYKLVAGGKDISLAEDNVDYIKVKVGEGDWQDLTANTDATLWFNVEATQGTRSYEVKTKDSKVYTATLNWENEIKPATWKATGGEGDHDGVTYVEYKLMDSENQVSLKEDEVKLIASKDADGKWVALEPNTDATLWFNKAHATGNYEFFVVTKDNGMCKATLAYTAPAVHEKANFVAVNSFGIHAGKVYAGYKLMAGEQQINLVASNIASMTVLEPGATEAKTLTVGDDSDPLLWFNVEKAEGNYVYTVVTKGEGAKTYEATLTWAAPKAATWAATGGEGDHDGVTYVEYKLMDSENQVSLKEGEVKLIASKDADGKWVALEPNTDATLWFNKAHATGNYEFFVVTKDNGMCKATLAYTAPAVPLPEQSTYELTHTGLAESYTAGQLIDVTGKDQAAINTAVEAAINGLEPVKVTLVTDVLGTTGYDAVRIAPVGAGEDIQIWAKDTLNNWHNINVTGWGLPEGFVLPANYDVTTDVYVLFDKAGDYTLNIKLVNVSNTDEVIAETSGTVKVSTVQVADESGLNTALADNNVKTIKFAKDITLNNTITIDKNVVIDGQDKKLTGTDSLRAFYVNIEGIDVTIQNINFETFKQGTTVDKAGKIAINKNTYTSVYRCMDFGSGLTSENVTITGNTFNLSESMRAVSYPVKATKDDINSILTDNTFTGSTTNPDYLIKYYSGKYHYHLANQPIIDCEVTDGEISIKVENKETSDHDNLGTITVTGEITDDALKTALEAQKSDFVDEITIDTTNKKVMIKSFDGKNTCYYEIEDSNGEGEGA